MRLFLASSFDQTVGFFIKKFAQDPQNRKALFLTNAADPFQDAPWVDPDRQAFIKAGFQLTELDLRKISSDELKKELESTDILHVCGGSVFYLLSLLKQGGFDRIIVDAVRDDKVIYTGTSAGSIVAAKSAWLYLHDEDEAKFAKGMCDTSGLGFVNFLIIPHCENPRFTESNKKMIIENLPKHSDPILLLYDSQAVCVEDGKLEILDTHI